MENIYNINVIIYNVGFVNLIWFGNWIKKLWLSFVFKVSYVFYRVCGCNLSFIYKFDLVMISIYWNYSIFVLIILICWLSVR